MAGVDATAFNSDGPTAAHRQHAEFMGELIYEPKPGGGSSELRKVTRKVAPVGLLLRTGKLGNPSKSAS